MGTEWIIAVTKNDSPEAAALGMENMNVVIQCERNVLVVPRDSHANFWFCAKGEVEIDM